jgi:cytochrome c-type biogenesis protein CcmF
MIPELAQFALVVALITAVVQTVFPLVGAHRSIGSWIAMARPAAYAQLLFIGFAYACLTYSFITYDFSVAYVAQNSNSELPLMYRISGVWGAHEGSLLLWVTILSVWTAAVAFFSRNIPADMIARVLGVMGLISIGFLAFLLFTSNPFVRWIPAPPNGNDLNPLLQDPGMAIHPPMLYMGYVGFSVAFAFSVAAMISGRLDMAWARWTRPWTTVAWLFLTAGITLGSWWAYYELGWGGWWFWDPVENASFMPWLVGTALIHSLAVTEKRGAFKAWTALLAITAFSLSLLGTFLVRSGVLTSVHAFATDPTRGTFILVFLSLVIGGSLILYAIRAPRIRSLITFDLFSRESNLLINNVLLCIAALMVLIGTLFPLIMDAIGSGKYSVGPPYFNFMFVPLTLPLALIVGIGAMSRWKSDQLNRFTKPAILFASISLVLAAVVTRILSLETFETGAMAALACAVWVTCWALFGIWDRVRLRSNKFRALGKIPPGFWGMTVAHLGIAVFIVGVTHVNTYSIEKNLRMLPGDEITLGRYTFTFNGVTRVDGPNYTADQGDFEVQVSDRHIISLLPQKRVYRQNPNPMTEAAIDGNLARDLYVSLGEQLDQGAWSIRIYLKSFVECIWLGGLLMALGGLIAVTDKRYRATKTARKSVRQGATEYAGSLAVEPAAEGPGGRAGEPA